MAWTVLKNVNDVEQTIVGPSSVFQDYYQVERSSQNIEFLKNNDLPLQPLPYRLNRSTIRTPRTRKYEAYWAIPPMFGTVIDPNIDQGKIDDLEARLAKAYYDKADSLDLDAGVSIAELPKTMSLIGGTATRFAGAFGSLRRGDVISAFRHLALPTGRHSNYLDRRAGSYDIRDPVRMLDFAANSWLELKYGWKPLLQEVYAAGEALGKSWDNDPSDIRHSVSGSVKFNARAKDLGTGNEASAEGATTYRITYVSHISVLDPSTRNASALGIVNPASIAWELVPYSFVVDWFLPVGSFIDAQTAFSGTSFCRGSKTVIKSEKTSGTTSKVKLPGGVFSVVMTEERSIYEMDRTVEQGHPSSTKILRFKPLDSVMNFDKVTTGLALLKKAFF